MNYIRVQALLSVFKKELVIFTNKNLLILFLVFIAVPVCGSSLGDKIEEVIVVVEKYPSVQSALRRLLDAENRLGESASFFSQKDWQDAFHDVKAAFFPLHLPGVDVNLDALFNLYQVFLEIQQKLIGANPLFMQEGGRSVSGSDREFFYHVLSLVGMAQKKLESVIGEDCLTDRSA